MESARDDVTMCGSVISGSDKTGIEGEVRSFFNKFSANIKTSVSGRKLWTAARYPTRFCIGLGDDITSKTLNAAHVISYPNISRYINLSRAVALMSRSCDRISVRHSLIAP